MLQHSFEYVSFSLEAMDKHNLNGGFSASVKDAVMPRDGFMVSLRGYEHRIPCRLISSYDVRDFMRVNVPNARRMKAGELFIGTWYDDETQTSYIDLSVNIADLGTALEVARKNGQRAIYDVTNARVIDVD